MCRPNVKSIVYFVFSLYLCFSFSNVFAQSTSTITNSSSVGMNLMWVKDWEAMLPFIDTFKKARAWSLQDNSAFASDQLDQYGWVKYLNSKQVAQTLVMIGKAPNEFPSGDYTVSYQGQGTVAYSGSAIVSQKHFSGYDVLTLDFTTAASDSAHQKGLIIQISSIPNLSDYPRNFHVILPGGICNNNPFQHFATAASCTSTGGTFRPYTDVYQELIFYPQFLSNLQSYNTLRFMQTWGTVSSPTATPQDFRSVDAATYWGQMPVEISAKLANRLNANMWINIPHLANDDLVTSIATKVYNNLNPNLKVYIEYSNEVWNNAFGFNEGRDIARLHCGDYSDLAAGCDLADTNPGDGVYCEGYPLQAAAGASTQVQQNINTTNTDCLTAVKRYYSDRTVQIMQIFQNVFGGRSRLVRVMGGWINDYNRAILSWHNNYQHVDALAVAPYFGIPENSMTHNFDIINSWIQQDTTNTYALNQLFTELKQGGVLLPYYLPGGQYYNPAMSAWQLPPADGEVNAQLDKLRGTGNQVGANEGTFHLAHSYGLDLIAYEGGQSLVYTGNNANISTQITNLFLAAQADSRMGDLYTQYLQGWKNVGGGLMNLYVNVGNGVFGMLNYEAQPSSSAPKVTATLNFIQQNICWWKNCTITTQSVCGDGFVEGSEMCDDGSSNGTSGDHCSSSCVVE